MLYSTMSIARRSSTAEIGEPSQYKESNVSSPSFVDNKNCEVEKEAEDDGCLIARDMFSVLERHNESSGEIKS